MAYIPPDVVEKVKQIDLLSYLKVYRPHELVKVSPNVYSTVSHDSLKISNGRWIWWSCGIGGRSALDYLIKVEGYSFLKAVEHLSDGMIDNPIISNPPKKEKVLVLPEKAKSNEAVIQYLRGRGIDHTIIDFFVEMDLIYESLPYHNAVFVGTDEDGNPRYAAYRAIKNMRIMGECEGSDKRFSFRYTNKISKSVHLFECAIDMLSYLTICKKEGLEWGRLNVVSLGGIYAPKEAVSDVKAEKLPIALESYLERHSNTERIYLHLDNDSAGRRASDMLTQILNKTYKVIDLPPPSGKDINDFLCYKYQNSIKKERNVKHENCDLSSEL